MKNKLVVFWIVLFELVVVAFLGVNIYLRQSKVLGETVSINPINKEDLIFPEEGNLKYFYEPAPNKIINNKPSWLPSDYSYTITTNTDNLNERFDYSIEKNPDVFRIVTIGDSYTYGLYVNTKENYPERLEDMLTDNSLCKSNKKFEVINLGVGGYDIEYSVQRFKVRGQKYNPDLVLWLIGNDDFTGINEIIKPKKDQYKKEIKADENLLSHFYSIGEFHPWSEKAAQELMEELSEDGVLAYNMRTLERMRDYYRERLVFITFSGEAWPALKDTYSLLLHDFSRVRGNTYFYNGLDSSFDHFEDWHPTSKGHAQIAGQIFDYLKQNGFVPCSSP